MVKTTKACVVALNGRTVSVSKNGRAVSMASALAALRKAFPDVHTSAWVLTKTAHSVVAERVDG